MSDQLYLSCWIRGFGALNMHRTLEKALNQFPFSRLSEIESTLRIYAIEMAEPPLIETAFPAPPDVAVIVKAAKEFPSPDCSYQLTTWWDLWLYETEWSVRPARVTVSCHGPEFRSEQGEHLLIEFGLDSRFLPHADVPNSLVMTRSNLRSLVKLVHELDQALPVEKRLIWSESGENFAERLREAVMEAE